jgi:hypothetical protein
MKRHKIAEWLASLPGNTNVIPVTAEINLSRRYNGASFTRDGEKMFYFSGKCPIQEEGFCFVVDYFDPEAADAYNPDDYEWYIGGVVQCEPCDEYPFGSHWVLIRWEIPGDDDSQIDDFSGYEYKRLEVLVKEG